MSNATTLGMFAESDRRSLPFTSAPSACASSRVREVLLLTVDRVRDGVEIGSTLAGPANAGCSTRERQVQDSRSPHRKAADIAFKCAS